MNLQSGSSSIDQLVRLETFLLDIFIKKILVGNFLRKNMKVWNNERYERARPERQIAYIYW